MTFEDFKNYISVRPDVIIEALNAYYKSPSQYITFAEGTYRKEGIRVKYITTDKIDETIDGAIKYLRSLDIFYTPGLKWDDIKFKLSSKACVAEFGTDNILELYPQTVVYVKPGDKLPIPSLSEELEKKMEEVNKRKIMIEATERLRIRNKIIDLCKLYEIDEDYYKDEYGFLTIEEIVDKLCYAAVERSIACKENEYLKTKYAAACDRADKNFDKILKLREEIETLKQFGADIDLRDTLYNICKKHDIPIYCGREFAGKTITEVFEDLVEALEDLVEALKNAQRDKKIAEDTAKTNENALKYWKRNADHYEKQLDKIQGVLND